MKNPAFTTSNTLNECSKGLVFVPNGDGTCTVSGIGTCTDTDIKIPPVHNGEKVTGIGVCAFFDCDSLTSITIPENVTEIGHFAFAKCDGLTNITIPSRVMTIGDSAFSGCSGLTNIAIPKNATIGFQAFRGIQEIVKK